MAYLKKLLAKSFLRQDDVSLDVDVNQGAGAGIARTSCFTLHREGYGIVAIDIVALENLGNAKALACIINKYHPRIDH